MTGVAVERAAHLDWQRMEPLCLASSVLSVETKDLNTSLYLSPEGFDGRGQLEAKRFGGHVT